MVEVPKLEPRHLFERRQRRDAARLRAYNTLLEQIYHKIYTCSQLPNHSPDILFNVPPFIMGLPRLDMKDCIVYLVFQLRSNGFEVNFTYPDLLHVSWKHHENNYFKNDNPIVRAMLPEPEPIQTRKTGGAKEGKGTAQLRSAMGARTGAPDVIFGAAGGQGLGQGQEKQVRFSEAVPPSMRGAPGFSLPPAPTQSAVPQIRQAAGYTPPAAFIQQLERPGPQRTPAPGSSGLADLWSLS
jgi:Family of unknown function (DUF5759)